MRAFLTILVMFTSISVMAVDPVPCEEEADLGTKLVEKAKEAQCGADAKKTLRGMCMYVGSRDVDPAPQGRFRFLYQKKLLEAACVDTKKDSEEVIAKKINKLWSENEKSFKCTNMQFDVQNGNIVKYAVNLNFDEFLIDVSQWKINLNKVDESDGKTVLDYVQMQIDRNKGNATEPTLRKYYDMLKKAGAKHKKEL